MKSTTMNRIFFGLCIVPGFLTPCFSADPPKKLGDLCPKLKLPAANSADGEQSETTIIDDAMVRLYGEQGRFAAIGPIQRSDESTSDTAETEKSKASNSKTRRQWRAEYQKSATAIRKLALRLAVAEEELKDLQEQYFRAGSEKARLRIDPRINRKKLQIEDLEKTLRQHKTSFSRLIREARQDGAQPGWFRDLQRP